MKERDEIFGRALVSSLLTEKLLLGDLPEADVWTIGLGGLPAEVRLNFDQKLGHLYEDAFECLLCKDSMWELLARNLQVFDKAGRTLGEMDFLIRHAVSGQVVHLELAVKFYLCWVDESGREHFPGPDPRDNWQAKLERMRSHQFRLSQTDEAKLLLAERFGVEEVTVAQRVYGNIFDHVSMDGTSSPPMVSQDCRRGRWLHCKEWDTRFGTVGAVRVVPKCLWPTQLDGEVLDQLEPVSIIELKKQAEQRCVLFWDEAKGESVFLVPDSWPGEVTLARGRVQGF